MTISTPKFEDQFLVESNKGSTNAWLVDRWQLGPLEGLEVQYRCIRCAFFVGFMVRLPTSHYPMSCILDETVPEPRAIV
jgi:hypothetical protein